MPLSEREARLAAEMGKPIPASTQKEVLNKAVEDTKKRVAQLKQQAEQERLAKEEAERLANLPPQGKRQRAMQDQVQQEQFYKEEVAREREIQNQQNTFSGFHQNTHNSEQKLQVGFDKPSLNQNTIREDLNNLKASNTSSFLFKPAEVTNIFKKRKVEELPSGMISYPENAEIYITPYSGDDIDELSNSELPLKHLLARCMEGVYTNFDKNKLTFYDTLYLSYLRRILSINPEDNKISVMSQCPYCNKWTSSVIDIKEQIEFEDVKVPKLPINVEFSFGKLQFTFLTYGDFMQLQTNLRSEELAYQCITPCEVQEGETPATELQTLFGSLVGEDQALLTKVKELTYHGIKPVNTLCQNTACGKTYETIIDEVSSVILPFRKSQSDIRTKVSFG